MKRLLIGIVATFVVLTGCSGSETAEVTNLNVTEFANVIATQDVVILDVRTPAEFAAGHVSNAVNLDVESGRFANEILNLDKSKTYAVYCRSGRRSAEAVKIMSDAGFTNLYNMNGGTIDWTNAGFPLSN